MDICDVISEKVSYCGRNIIGPDLMPRISDQGLRYFCAHGHLKKTFLSLSVLQSVLLIKNAIAKV